MFKFNVTKVARLTRNFYGKRKKKTLRERKIQAEFNFKKGERENDFKSFKDKFYNLLF